MKDKLVNAIERIMLMTYVYTFSIIEIKVNGKI